MQALVFEKPQVLSIHDIEQPVPGAGEALLRVLSTGICGSELHALQGEHPYRIPPAILGHEVSAAVETAPVGWEELLPGTRVAVMPQKVCGRCTPCRRNEPNLCNNRIMLGFPAWPGSYAAYFLAPAELLFPLPDQVSDDVGTLVEPLAVGIHAVKRSGLKLGDSALVLGSGAIGLMTVLAARAAGAAKIIASDIKAFNLQKALEAGAAHTVDAAKEDVAALARSQTRGEGVDCAFIAADAPDLLEQAIRSVRKRGTIMMIGMFTAPITINLQQARITEQVLQGSVTYDEDDFRAALHLAVRKHATLASFITHSFELSAGQRAFALAADRNENVVRVVFHPSS